jgi:hypothetical protein
VEHSVSDTEQLEMDARPWKLVTHQYPDTDAWACVWAAARFIVPPESDFSINFVSAGSLLTPEESEGFNVLYMDTGLGDCDQHGRELVRASSFQLVVGKYCLERYPGLAPILELTRATDNVERIDPTSVHYYFKGLPYFLRNSATREINWQWVYERVFEVFDVIYSQEVQRLEAQAKFRLLGKNNRLRNGIRVSTLLWMPNLREAAYESGSDVVLWTESRGKKNYNVGVQVNRDSSVTLVGVVRALRLAEAEKRGITLSPDEAEMIGVHPQIPGWFLHDSKKLVLCGSRSSRLGPDEFTQLRHFELQPLILNVLDLLPKQRR